MMRMHSVRRAWEIEGRIVTLLLRKTPERNAQAALLFHKTRKKHDGNKNRTAAVACTVGCLARKGLSRLLVFACFTEGLSDAHHCQQPQRTLAVARALLCDSRMKCTRS